MRIIISALLGLILFCSGGIAQAADNTTIFPPKKVDGTDCNAAQTRVLAWENGAATTYCLDGQQVLDLAIPTCASGQVVTRGDDKFECKTPLVPDVCREGQVLAYTKGGFVCVDINERSIPTCGQGQFLTYDGQNFICSNAGGNGNLNVSCPAGKVLAGIQNNQPVCVVINTEQPPPGVQQIFVKRINISTTATASAGDQVTAATVKGIKAYYGVANTQAFNAWYGWCGLGRGDNTLNYFIGGDIFAEKCLQFLCKGEIEGQPNIAFAQKIDFCLAGGPYCSPTISTIIASCFITK